MSPKVTSLKRSSILVKKNSSSRTLRKAVSKNRPPKFPALFGDIFRSEGKLTGIRFL